MIGKLKGIVDTRSQERCIIDVGGVGYLVQISTKTLDALPQEGEAVSLYIETHVREDHIHLYGFVSPIEQEWFTILTTVKGVGTRMALAILSSFSGDELNGIFMSGDHKTLTQVSGVGPKLALRLTTELKDKTASSADAFVAQAGSSTVTTSVTAGHQIMSDAVSALENLGYARNHAHGIIADLLKDSPDLTVEDLIRLGLKELSA